MPLADYTLGQNAMSYLKRMASLCKEKDITLVLVKAPVLYPHWYVVVPSMLWATAVGFSRLYLGVHYFGDLLVGMLIGCVFAAIIYYLLVWMAKIKKPLDVRHAFVPIYTILVTIACFLMIATFETYLL